MKMSYISLIGAADCNTSQTSDQAGMKAHFHGELTPNVLKNNPHLLNTAVSDFMK